MILFDPTLHLLVNAVDDLEAVRIATENRYRTLTERDASKGGFGLLESDKVVIATKKQAEALRAVEHEAVKALERQMKQHPLASWIKITPGLGLKTVARLLGAVHDPYWHEGNNRPRTLAEFRSYCGLGDASVQRLRKGQKVTWSPEARKRFYVISEGMIKNRESAYRHVYDETRTKYADAIHDEPCVRCGPSGKPAPAGSPLSDAHKHARAIRAVSKAVAKDLWLESKRLHEAVQAKAA